MRNVSTYIIRIDSLLVLKPSEDKAQHTLDKPQPIRVWTTIREVQTILKELSQELNVPLGFPEIRECVNLSKEIVDLPRFLRQDSSRSYAILMLKFLLSLDKPISPFSSSNHINR